MWVYLLAFSVFLASGCGGTREYCKRSPLPPSTPNPPDLAAGEYRITLFLPNAVYAKENLPQDDCSSVSSTSGVA